MNLDKLIERLQALELEGGSHVPVYVVDNRSGVSDLVESAISRKNEHDYIVGDLLDLKEGLKYVEIVIG